MICKNKKKAKAISIRGHGGLYCCEMLRITHCLDSPLTDDNEVITLTRWLRSTPQKHYLVLISVRGRVKPAAIVQLEGLDQLKQMQWL
jgi:hypothetical protein